MRFGQVIDGGISKVEIRETPIKYEDGLKSFKELAGKPDKIIGGIAGQWNKDKSVIIKSPNLPDWEGHNIKLDLSERLGCDVLLENDAALGGLGEAVYGAGKSANIVAYLAFGTGVGGVRIVNKTIDNNFLGFEPGRMIVENPYSLEEKIKTRQDLDRWLEVAISNTIAMWSPEIVIIGGGLGLHMDLPNNPIVVRAQLGDEAGLWGAMAIEDR